MKSYWRVTWSDGMVEHVILDTWKTSSGIVHTLLEMENDDPVRWITAVEEETEEYEE